MEFLDIREPGGRSLRHIIKRAVLVFLLGLVAAFIIILALLGNEARVATKRGGQQPAEPFRIAGNFYYVGANDISAFLITGSEGHVVLDAGYPTTAPMIMASIAKLGFDIKDVKVLLNSDRTPTTRAGWQSSSRRPAPSCGPAKRARTSSRRAATIPTSSCR
jgi:hypothetical protein